MNDGNSAREAELVRAHLHRLVEDVEPRPDALPRLLAAARRRRSPRRPLIAALGAVGAAAVAFLVAVVFVPQQPELAPVSVQPNTYLAAPQPGVIASFDVLSGQENSQVATVTGADTTVLAADRDRVYTVVSTADGRRVAEVSARGQRVLPGKVGDSRVLAAGGGRVAYLDGTDVVVVHDQQQHRIPVPAHLRVEDLALAADGRLAVLVTPRDGGQASSVLVLPPDATSLSARVEATSGEACGPVAVAWTGRDVAALQPVDCADDRLRVATFAGDSGRKIGAGTVFRTPPLAPGSARLSTDVLGRFLVSTAGQGQWLVDGSAVRPIPPACTTDGVCAAGPGTFWG
ncbi:hypothetical protein GCM10011581_17620 [Saccharopolyspora subtropica]|uniref:FbpC C-terminal regulatory nucleotide binding domain-containing protein n=1 Tax=Saccharopolyspora thermophila TaxID=89367 RepID=A0A917NBG5_9PSEU|nr:hypothetical protein [Saccharopolyspora subtropica]GGI80771.1 hypothetical protein GCM10011581_17620 [Saccharopolyspora subtropica]